jgi:phenylpropionate dioxygenase-like ring-hydroxylating dioxygenase large terminal subunit
MRPRCVYHGWKYDVEGNVLDTPTEPAGSDFKAKLKHKAYPTVEAAESSLRTWGRRRRYRFP